MGDAQQAPSGTPGHFPGLNPRIAARVVRGETLILTPHDSVLHTLNGVATRIWELMAVHHDADGIAAALASEYEVTEEEAREDVSALLTRMREVGILEA